MPDPREGDVYDFVMNFVNHSRTYRQRFEPIWEELYANYRVQPYYGYNDPGELGIGMANNYIGRGNISRSVLKDPESHQVVETLLAQVMLSCFQQRNYIMADPVGREDTDSGKTVSKLIQYALERPGHYENMYQVLKDCFVFGTGIYQVPWEYFGRNALLSQNGQLERKFQVITDDPGLHPVSLYDFFPDPSATSVRTMTACAKHFRMTAGQAKAFAAQGVFDSGVVDIAIAAGRKTESERRDQVLQGLDGVSISDLAYAPDYTMVEGYELWTVDVPWKPSDGFTSRVITVLTDVPHKPARNAASPFVDGELPFGEVKSNPIGSRFYGLSPLEINRYLQDHADILLMSRTDAVMQEVKGSWKVLDGLARDPGLLRKGLPNQVHLVDDKDAILPMEFNHTLQHAYLEAQTQKGNMRQASGANDPVQGIGSRPGTTATEIATNAQQAMTRIQLTCNLLEREYFGRIGRLIHSRYAQFLDDEGIMKRVGNDPEPAKLDEIQEQFNYRFIGSRQTGGKQQKAAALREAITVLGGIPFLAAQVNWNSLIAKYLEDGLDIKDFTDFIASPEQLAENVALQQQSQQGQGSVAGQAAQPQSDGRSASQVGGTLT